MPHLDWDRDVTRGFVVGPVQCPTELVDEYGVFTRDVRAALIEDGFVEGVAGLEIPRDCLPSERPPSSKRGLVTVSNQYCDASTGD